MVRRALHPGVFLEVGIHVTRFGMFRSRAGIAAQLLFTASSYWTACRRRPFLHTQGDIQTAPPSRSRVKNSYPLIGMLSRGKIVRPSQRPHPAFRFARTGATLPRLLRRRLKA